MTIKKVLFLTWTRADYWKIRSLIREVDKHDNFESYVFVTWMHMMSKYWFTSKEVIKENHQNVYLNINQHVWEKPEIVIANTIRNLSQYIHEINPDLIVIHWDRVEALAWVIAWSFANILVAHVEWWESSGSIDESVRHSISKLSHIHFVANEKSADKLEQMWEERKNIYSIWSPDFDAMFWNELSNIDKLKVKYDIPFKEYGIFIFHSVTTETSDFEEYCINVLSGLIESKKKFILIYPNNDPSSDIVINYFNKYLSDKDFKESYRIFESIPFNAFLTVLKNAKCIVWNSSAWVRQAPTIWIPTVNIWTRQNNRNDWESIHNVWYDSNEVNNKISEIWKDDKIYPKCLTFGDWKAWDRFIKILETEKFWETPIQK